MKKIVSVAVVATACILASGCTAAWNELMGFGSPRSGTSSSLVDFLYPDGKTPPGFSDSMPVLELPLRVGVAFVPGSQRQTEGLSEAHKNTLLGQVRDSFSDYDFIKEIMIVPDTYMRSEGGFDNVDQIARLYGLDVMGLVSYDQVAFIEENWKSITYWTIIGAYVFEGSEHDVKTFVDAAVFDVASHQLLFRAPGSSTVHGASKLVDHPEKFREAREAGFDSAVEQMIANLDDELARFREDIKKEEARVQVTHAPGFSGGMDAWSLVLLCGLAAMAAGVRKFS